MWARSYWNQETGDAHPAEQDPNSSSPPRYVPIPCSLTLGVAALNPAAPRTEIIKFAPG